CADPACSAWACAPTVSGWTGPFELYEGAAGISPPPCAGAFGGAQYAGNTGLSYTPATCSQCACSTPSGVTCGAATVTTSASPACAPTCGSVMVGATCATLPPCGDAGTISAVTVAAATPSGGSCTPSGGVPTKTSPTWSVVARACGVTRIGSGSCMNGTY